MARKEWPNVATISEVHCRTNRINWYVRENLTLQICLLGLDARKFSCAKISTFTVFAIHVMQIYRKTRTSFILILDTAATKSNKKLATFDLILVCNMLGFISSRTEIVQACFWQGTHCTGKTGKMAKTKSLSGKTQGIWKFCQNTGKTQGIWFAQVVNSLILKVKDILKFAVKITKIFLKLDKSAKSVFYSML